MCLSKHQTATATTLLVLALFCGGSCPLIADVLYNSSVVNLGGTTTACTDLTCLSSLTTQMFVAPFAPGPFPCLLTVSSPNCLIVENGFFTPANQGAVLKLTDADFPNFDTLVSDLTNSSGWALSLDVLLPGNRPIFGGGGADLRPITGQISEVDLTLTEFCISPSTTCQVPAPGPTRNFDTVIEIQMTVLGTAAPEPPTAAIVLLVLVALFSFRRSLRAVTQ